MGLHQSSEQQVLPTVELNWQQPMQHLFKVQNAKSFVSLCADGYEVEIFFAQSREFVPFL